MSQHGLADLITTIGRSDTIGRCPAVFRPVEELISRKIRSLNNSVKGPGIIVGKLKSCEIIMPGLLRADLSGHRLKLRSKGAPTETFATPVTL